MFPNETDSTVSDGFTPIIKRYMRVDDITWGKAKDGFLVRYRGELLGDSESLYDQVAQALKPSHVTPLFRMDDGQHCIKLIEGVVEPKPSNPVINLGMFIITIFSVLLAGALYLYTEPIPDQLLPALIYIFRNIAITKVLYTGWPFAISMLTILLAHEFGHYLAARRQKTAVTLPYFIPFPLSAFGTMGAFIQLKEPPKNRNVLLDIGVAGPLAGLVITIPVLIYGLYTSTVHDLPQVLSPLQSFEGNSIFYLAVKYLIHGQLLPHPADYGNLSPMLYWIRYFFTGMPLPRGGVDVTINQVAWAGWAGLLVTSLNLIPVGQLDGGHLMYVLFGKKIRKLMPIILVAMFVMGFVYAGWWIWAALLFFLGGRYAEPLDQITPLDPRRKAVAILGLVIFVLIFTPVPLATGFGG